MEMSSESKALPQSNFRRTQGFTAGSKTRKQAKNRLSEGKKCREGGDGADEDGDLCLICADKLSYVALSACSHRTCYRCAFRQRALYEKKSCLICRTENDSLTFTDQLDKEFADIQDFTDHDEKYGINFTSHKIAETTLGLLKYDCSLCPQDGREDFGSFKKYNEHLRVMHSKNICMICASHKHAFPTELKIYTPNQLRNHQSKGDSKGFKGHPMCAFCSGKRFYSDDELYLHMRHQHEKCHICDRIDPSSPQYFKDYDQLFDHFKNCHYICTVNTCLDNKFVVFADELELQAHILKEHGDIIRGKPRLFQSELSTFISAPSRVITENNALNNGFSSNSSGSSRRRSPAVPNESLREKKLRLEERAKYYLGNSQSEFETFQRFNEDYDKNRLNARGLFDAYKGLFSSPEADVYLLVHNLAETYSPNTSKYKELNSIYEAHEARNTRKNELPSLSRDPSSSTHIVNGVWGANNNSVSTNQGKNVNTMNLPTLKSPPANHDPFSLPYRTHSYKNLSTPKRSSPLPVVKKAAADSSAVVTPKYLENRQKSSSSSSLSSGSTNKLAGLDLPTLPTPKPKVYIPPVNRPNLPDPKKWGQKPEKSQDADGASELNTGSSGKKKGKQKQLLFHIGI